MFFKKKPISINTDVSLAQVSIKCCDAIFIIIPIESLNENTQKKYSFMIKKKDNNIEEVIAFGRETYYTPKDAKKAAFSYILDDCILNI